MRLLKFLPLIIIVILFAACNASPEEAERAMQEYVATADTMAMTEGGDLADLNSDSRKVIRKADIRCRVNNVQQAVHELETFTAMAEGFVQESHMRNDILSEKVSNHDDDSLKKAQVYQPTANMVIRIPYYALDTLSARIAQLSDFIHYRNMTREDVTLQFMSNMLKNRETSKEKPVTTAQVQKTKDPVAAAQYQDNKTSQQIDRKIANLSILDDSRYATLSLELYQPEQISVIVTQNVDKAIAKTYGEKVGAALGNSIDIIKNFVLAIIATWPVWVAIAALVYWYKRMAKRRKALAINE